MFRPSHKNCNNLWSSPWCCFQLSSGLWFHGKVLWRAAAVLCGGSCRGAGRGGDSKERLKPPLDLPSILDALDALDALYAFMLLCAAAGRIFPGSVAEAKAGALIFAFGIIVLISNFFARLVNISDPAKRWSLSEGTCVCCRSVSHKTNFIAQIRCWRLGIR